MYLQELAENISKAFFANFTNLSFKLLEKNPVTRMGCGPEGAEEIKKHSCFSFNWKRIEAAIESPPFTPDVTHKLV